MDPVIHLSEGHRSDMLLDLSGLTREERVIVQASINNERIISENVRVERRAKAKTGSNVKTVQTLVGSAEKARANTLAAENLEQVPITRTLLPLKITIMMTT